VPYIELRKDYYTPNEIARMAGVSRQTVIAWIRDGHIESTVTTGGHHRIPASAIKGADPVQRVELTVTK
jgi:excisionase family DNA binding protein